MADVKCDWCGREFDENASSEHYPQFWICKKCGDAAERNAEVDHHMPEDF